MLVGRCHVYIIWENTPYMFSVIRLVLLNKHLGSETCSWILDLSSSFFKGSLLQSFFNATELCIITLGSNNFSGDLPESKQFH